MHHIGPQTITHPEQTHSETGCFAVNRTSGAFCSFTHSYCEIIPTVIITHFLHAFLAFLVKFLLNLSKTLVILHYTNNYYLMKCFNVKVPAVTLQVMIIQNQVTSESFM